MFHPSRIVQRFRRTDQHRLGEWLPLGSPWKTVASPALVAHDLYHHLESDTGTFAQEVRALGAEWFVDLQKTSRSPADLSLSESASLQRLCKDNVLNAAESKEVAPFALAIDPSGERLGPQEMALFADLADFSLGHARDARPGEETNDFRAAFVSLVLAGYHQARARFPDQMRVRRASQGLRNALRAVELSDVPYGHDITVTLDGYDCTIDHEDADAAFLAETQVSKALLMLWCSCAPGHPVVGATLHESEADYHDCVHAHFQTEDERLADDLRFLPQADARWLQTVYLRDPALQAAVQDERTMGILLDVIKTADRTPRGVYVL